MFPRHKLHGYQDRGARHIFDHQRAMLHFEMSLGKTITVLTAVTDLFDQVLIHGVLVLAPRRVSELVWKQEAAKWSHTAHLRVCVLRGKSKAHLARDLVRPYDVWVINYEALAWLATELNRLFFARGRFPPFDMLIFDEVTRVKNYNGARVANLYAANKHGTRLIDFMPRRVGLTGTPAPNGYQDLFGQYYAVDDGRALERDEKVFTERYFSVDPFTGHKSLRSGAKNRIEERIAPITLSLQAKDYIRLPEYITNDLWIELPKKTRAQYDEFEQTMFAELDHGTLEVFNVVSVVATCRQLANGMVIDTQTGDWVPVHDAKLEALDEVIEEAGGAPLLVGYVFRADMERILRRYQKRLRVGYLGPGISEAKAVEIYETWNRQGFDLLLLHHQSGGHGLNMQAGGNQLVRFGLDWPLEGHLQLAARLRRQGQLADHVIIHQILARDTIDVAMRDRLESKEKEQDDLTSALQALQAYRENKRH